MGGVWVFPGGAVDADEGDGDEAHRAAAIRELREEAAIALDDPAALVKFSRWITPAAVKIRFDTHFFLAPLPEARSRGSTARSASISAGSRPRRRSRPTREGEIVLVFPTIKHLEQLSAFATVDALLDYAREREVAAGRAARRDRGRGRPHPAAGRARLLTARAAQACCWASITWVTALISARWVKACG